MLGWDETRSPSSPSSSRRRRTAAWRSGRASPDTEMPAERLEGEPITLRPLPGDDRQGQVGEQELAAGRLARGDIGEVHFHEWYRHREQRVTDGQAGMGVGRRVEDQSVCGGRERLDLVDQGAFVVGLEKAERGAQPGRLDAKHRFDVREGRRAVDGWFAGTEEIEVRAVENRNPHLALETAQPGVELLQILGDL